MISNNIEVVIVGIGQTDVGLLWEESLRGLATQAIQAARQDAGMLKPEVLYVGNMLAASASHQANLGALLTEYSGMVGVEGVTVEAADASGAAALRMAYTAIKSGMIDCAMAVGVEKYTDITGADVDNIVAQILDADYEASEGLTPMAQASMLMQRYIYEYQPTREALAGFAMTAHANAVANPHAMYRKAIRLETYLKSGAVDEPLNMFDIAPYADGAAAVLLTRADKLPEGLLNAPVRIVGSSLVVDRLAVHDREDPLYWSGAALSVQKACDQAGITPNDVGFFEYADITTLHAILSLEAAGFAPRGNGWRMAADGNLSLTGSLPVATLGGFKARGHALGASGLYQTVEAVLQLRGQAGGSQVVGAKMGMIQALGGPAATSVTHILKKW